MREQPRNRRRGMTLVEVMIAVLILAVGALGVMGLLRGLSYQLFYASRMTVATEMARSRMEQLLAADYATLAGGSDTEGIYQTVWTIGGEVNKTRSLQVQTTFSGPDGRTITNVLFRSLSRDPTAPLSDVPFTLPEDLLES